MGFEKVHPAAEGMAEEVAELVDDATAEAVANGLCAIARKFGLPATDRTARVLFAHGRDLIDQVASIPYVVLALELVGVFLDKPKPASTHTVETSTVPTPPAAPSAAEPAAPDKE
jgi:hypothetical protein